MALKVGVVGMRGIGSMHTDCHMKDPLSELVAVCDVVRERADEQAAKHNVKAYYSLAGMLENEPDLDIIDVTTGGFENGSWHYEPAMQAMEAGKHVLVEKPLSNDVGEARQMVKKAAEKNVYLGCNLNHYFTPPAQEARKFMDEDRIGELIYCLHKMGFSAGEENYSPPGSSRFKGFPYAHLKAFLSHPFSVMRHFCGDVTHVQAFVNRPGFRRRVNDVMLSTVSIHVKFANDCVGYLLSQRGDAAYGLGGWWSIEVAGTKGTFCIENCIEKVTFWSAVKPDEPETISTGITDFGDTFPRRIHAFLEDITNGIHKEDLRASGRDALAALEYTWAVMESYERGGEMVRPHPLPPIHGDPAKLLE
jgi:predicted dehydrogenase